MYLTMQQLLVEILSKSQEVHYHANYIVKPFLKKLTLNFSLVQFLIVSHPILLILHGNLLKRSKYFLIERKKEKKGEGVV